MPHGLSLCIQIELNFERDALICSWKLDEAVDSSTRSKELTKHNSQGPSGAKGCIQRRAAPLMWMFRVQEDSVNREYIKPIGDGD